MMLADASVQLLDERELREPIQFEGQRVPLYAVLFSSDDLIV